MFVPPLLTPVAMPLALTVATTALLELQVTEPEMLPLLPSEKLPVAVKVKVAPWTMIAAAGVTAMLETVAVVTVMLSAGEVIPFKEAVMVVVPAATGVTTPVPAAIVAVAGLAEVQITELVMSADVPLAKDPMAVRCAGVPNGSSADAGVMLMLVSALLPPGGVDGGCTGAPGSGGNPPPPDPPPPQPSSKRTNRAANAIPNPTLCRGAPEDCISDLFQALRKLKQLPCYCNTLCALAGTDNNCNSPYAGGESL